MMRKNGLPLTRQCSSPVSGTDSDRHSARSVGNHKLYWLDVLRSRVCWD